MSDRDNDSSGKDEKNKPAESHDQADWKDRMTSPKWIAGLAVPVVLVAGLGWFITSWFGGDDEQPQQPPVTVTADQAQQLAWQNTLQSVGTITARQGVEITSELAGKVENIYFEPGQTIAAGEPLIKLDTSREEADLAALKAQLLQAQNESARARRLVSRNAVSQEEAEQRSAEVKRLKAEAARAQATLDLKNIQAPFSGTLGIRLVDLGEYVQPGTTIVSLQQLDDLFINFSIPESDIAELATGQQVLASVAAYPDKQFTGQITTINPAIAAASRSVMVQATFANDNRQLRPGMFAELRIELDDDKDIIAIPESAVSRNAYGTSVYVVTTAKNAENQKDNQSSSDDNSDQDTQSRDKQDQDKQLVAEQRFIELGERRGQQIAVTDGLEAGERIVTGGLVNLNNGAPIKISDENTLADLPDNPGTPGLEKSQPDNQTDSAKGQSETTQASHVAKSDNQDNG